VGSKESQGFAEGGQGLAIVGDGDEVLYAVKREGLGLPGGREEGEEGGVLERPVGRGVEGDGAPGGEGAVDRPVGRDQYGGYGIWRGAGTRNGLGMTRMGVCSRRGGKTFMREAETTSREENGL